MALLRRDDWLTTPQGQALAGAQVYYLTQPADTTDFPPSPLAEVYANSTGTPADNPQPTDGYGHAVAYLNDSQLYTIAFYHPLLGPEPLVLADQAGQGGTSTSGVTPFGMVPVGTIDGTNRNFTLPFLPALLNVWKNFPLIAGLGFTTAVLSGVFTITYATAPQPASGDNPGDNIYANGFY